MTGVNSTKSMHTLKKKKVYSAFDLILVLFFFITSIIIIIPLWKVLVDSFDLHTAYGLRLFPKKFGFAGYKNIFTNPTMLRPIFVSIYTTVVGTFMGLAIATLGAYTLVQKKMPGNSFFGGYLLFTMIFSGGMIPTYLVLRSLGLTNTLWSVILLPTVGVYNLVLMKSFFDGIPSSLFEAAEIDGSSHINTYFKIVLPLSKAALASIGLMYGVAYWNDYTNYRLFITNSLLYNFQMKLYTIMHGSDMSTANFMATENTIKNACIMIGLVPFIIVYPFCQKYFIKGITLGAVKG